MTEYRYGFIKNNRLVNTMIFASQDEEFADRVAQEKGYDDAVWLGEENPIKWSEYDGTTFTPPTRDYLVSIGIIKTGDQEHEQMIQETILLTQQAESE